MNDPDPTADDAGARLIARIVERAALPADYEHFDVLARATPDRWSDLLAALRDDDALHLALDESLRPAEQVELPALPSHAGRLRSLRPWTGWLAAAALAAIWLAGSTGTDPIDAAPGLAGSEQVALSPAPPADGPRLRDEPLQAGDSVLGELPLRLVGTQPAADGDGLELLYVQPVVRRTRIDGVFQVRTDEHGRPAPVPVDPAVLVRRESL
jgi:hypothetical protein